MPYFSGSQRELYYRASGKGSDALVFIHGWYQNGAQAWGTLAPAFEKKYRVFVPDLPGHGLSPLGEAKNFSTALNENLILEFIAYVKKQYRCRRVILIGHSYGAFAVLSLAAGHAKTLHGVVAMAAIDDYAPYAARLKRVLMIPKAIEGLYYRLQAVLGLFPYGDRMLLYGKNPPELVPGKLAYAGIKNRTLSTRSSRAYMTAFTRARVTWPSEKLSTPCLLLYGERDALTASSWAAKILPHFKTGDSAVVPKAGHNVQISGAAEVAGRLMSFFEKSFRHRA